MSESQPKGNYEARELDYLETINRLANDPTNQIDKECSKGINPWTACVRTVLQVISGAANLGEIFTPEYVARVDREIAEIGVDLAQYDRDHKDQTKAPFEAPDNSFKTHIFSLISNLAPEESEIIKN